MNGDFILEMTHITKTFPGVRALDDVCFDLNKGEVHALVGENGAGKSTLIKILGGVYLQDSGAITVNGREARIRNPHDSKEYGIGVIYQEFNLVPTLSIAENIFLGKEITHNKVLELMDRSAMEQKSGEILKSLGLDSVSTRTPIDRLSVAQQQLVEIGKAMFNDINILVMDEPTAVLTEKETEYLFGIVERLKTQGVSIIYISHRLEEVQRISDRITVLRDGKSITTMMNGERAVSRESIINHMVGRDLADYFPARRVPVGDGSVLEVKNLSQGNLFRDINFTLRKGEILGFAGLIGAGRSELMKTIYGALKGTAGETGRERSGEVVIDNQPLKIKSPLTAIKQGIGLVPEDRKHEGLVLSMSLGDNICLPNYDKISAGGFIRKNKRKTLIHRFIERLSIRPNLPDRLVSEFSGGNQQKAVISKWLAINPKVLILDEPTRGIDVGAKSEIYTLMRDLTEQGVSIIFISSELLEIIGMCDRVLVMCEGRINGEFTGGEISQEGIMRAASGLVQ